MAKRPNRKNAADKQEILIVNLSGLSDTLWQGWIDTAFPEDTAWQQAAISSADELSTLKSGHQILLIYCAPDRAFLEAMETGTPPSRGLEGWQETMQAILQFYRVHRRNVFLIDADAFTAEPDNLRKALSAWLGCRLEKGPFPEQTGETGIVRILTSCAATAIAPLRQICDELEAGGISPRLAGQVGIKDLDAAFAFSWTQNPSRAGGGEIPATQPDKDTLLLLKMTAERDTILQENNQLTRQLRMAQEALERNYRAGATGGPNSSQEPNGQDSEARHHLIFQDRASEMELEILRLRQQLEKTVQELATQSGECAALRRTLADSRQEIDVLLNSKSWRLTAPLRNIRRRLFEPRSDP